MTPIGPTGPRFRTIPGNWGTGGANSYAALTTALSGSNNDLTYAAKSRGSASNSVRVRYVVAGNSTALSVSVSSNDITVNVATDSGGAATSTAAQVRDAVNASAPASALVTASNATGNDGTGVVAALSFTALSGGAEYVIGYGGNNTVSRQAPL